MNTGTTIVRVVTVVVLLCASHALHADTVVLDENLTDLACNPTDPKVTCAVSGGSFSGAGWRTDAGAISRLVFDMSAAAPDGIPCGHVEFEVTNFDPVTNFNVLGECYVIVLGAYEAAHGEHWAASKADQAWIQIKGKTESKCPGVEPGAYPKENRFKFGAFACSWDYPECPTTAPAYVPDMGEYSIDWKSTLSLTYTVQADWDCAGVSYGVDDGTHTWTGAGTYGWHAGHPDPQPHIRYVFLGKDFSGGASFIGDAVYTRVKVVRKDACNCPATTADGGMPDSGGHDAGTVTDGGAGTEHQFTVVADTYANVGEPAANFGGATDIRVGADAASQPTRISYLRFNVTGLTGGVQRAKIHLQVMNNGGGGGIHAVLDNSWNELALTWNNKPTHDAAVLASQGMVSVDQVVSFDVTSAVTQNGVYSFAIVSNVEDGSGYYSKESGEMKPYLEVIEGSGPLPDGGAIDDTGAGDTGGSADTGVAQDAGAISDTGAANDAASMIDAGAPADAQVPTDGGKSGAVEPFEYDTLGCGCSSLGI